MEKNDLSYSYSDYEFPADWNEHKIDDLVALIERPIAMEDSEEYDLITVKRNFGGIVSRGKLLGKDILVKNQFQIKDGDFVISKRQIAHGACSIVTKEFKDSIVSNEYNVLNSKGNLSLDFFKYYVQLPFMKRYFYITSDGVHIEKLLFKPKSWIKRKVCIPAKPEQEKIGEILSAHEKLINSKIRIIEERKLQQRNIMQNLLTGKKRLKGFKKDWKEIRLENVLKERKEVGYNHLELLAITMNNGVARRNGLDLVDNSSKDKSKYKRILPLDIGYNTMRMWQGVSGVSEYEGIVSPAYTVLKPTDKVDSHFMSYLFQLPKVIDTFRRYSQGLVSDTLNLKYENFKGIKLTIPTDIKEQKAIAEILKLQDKEIELLNKEVKLLKEQKKGLMQLLLTGKVRVNC
ncbi:MAG: restriction endonuclease subunit S [Clostridia bacterium]|nr:restriction endonuclease subunit S [Clostridia bacterium]